MKTRFFIIALGIFLIYGCADVCKLTGDDKDWLLEKHKSLKYRENGTNTLKVSVKTHFSTSYSSDDWSPFSEGQEWGESTLYLRDSLYMLSIISSACDNSGSILLYKKKHSLHVVRFPYYKNSLTNHTVTVLGKEYENCFVYKDSTYIKNLTFVKKHGIVNIEFRDGYKLELIP